MKNKYILFILVLMLVLSGCGNSTSTAKKEHPSNDNSITDHEDNSESTSAPVDADFSSTDEDMFSNKDYNAEYHNDSNVIIQLNGDSATCNSDAVSISGTTITITDEGTYVITGSLNDGMIVVNADENDKPQIVFNGVSITNKTSAALYILEADKVFITLNNGTSNTLNNGGTFEAIDGNSIDGTVFSKQDLTFNGLGTLTINSPAGHGIVCKDDLVFTGGTYTVNCASHGVDANDSVRISEASISIDAGKDGIHSENSDDTTLGYVYISSGVLNIEAEGDGISAYAYAQIEGGSIDIVAGGGSENGASHSSGNYGGFMGGKPGQMSSSSTSTSTDSTSMKGIKATGSILISSGTIDIDSADDSIHANNSVIINEGTLALASGDDGIHADLELTITAGKINIVKCYEGLEAVDIVVSGGDISLVASDDGLNAAGGTDSSGTGGRDNGMFGGGGPGGHGGMGGQMSSSSNGSILVSGGNLYINSSGDGMDANGTLEISGGYTVVVGPTQGDTATLDYDVSGIITGGTFIGTGASGMAQTFSSSENQGVIAVSVGTMVADTQITLKDSDNNTIISYAPELSFGVVILSSPDITKGETYSITVGEASGEFEAS